MADPIIGKISVGDGATFTPAVDEDGVLSWSNNKNLENPAAVDLPQAVMDRYQIAPIASPAFTGNPTAPTQAKTDNSTKLATTAYVQAVVADYLELTGGSITGDVDITGDLSVSGAITGNVTGDLTGNVTGNVTGTASGNLALSGGTMTGSIQYVNNGKVFAIGNTTTGNVDLGWSWDNREGAGIGLRSTDYSNPGEFTLFARDANNTCSLTGRPNGDLTWNGKNLNHTIDLSVFKTAQQFTAPSIVSSRVKDLGGGYKKVGNIVYVYVRFRLNTTLTKGGWGVLNGFPAPYNMGFSAEYRIPLIATAWYGDPYSGNVSSAFMDTDGTMRLITNGQMETSNYSTYYIYVYGTYYAE